MLADRLEGLPDMSVMSETELAALLRDLDRQQRAVEAKLTAVVEHVATTNAHLDSGHRSVSAWLRATQLWSNAEAMHRVKTANLVHHVDEVADAMATADLGVAQVRELARVHANPRVADQLPSVIGLFVESAQRFEFDDFRALTTRWEQLADQDGAHRRADQAWRNRHASAVEVDGVLHISAMLTGLQAAVWKTVFDQHCDAEFAIDWTQAVAAHGDRATNDVLARTAKQRGADAMATMAIRSVSVPHDAVAPEPLVHIVCDATTLHETLTGDTAERIDPRERACETRDGFPLPPGDVLAAMWWGQVRKVLVDPNGVTIDLGRRQRLFTGAARDAVLLRSRRCVWPGCRTVAGRCEADHLHEHHLGGLTDQANAAPLCRHHNRFKHRAHATITRHPDGTWHTHLPNQPTTPDSRHDPGPEAA